MKQYTVVTNDDGCLFYVEENCNQCADWMTVQKYKEPPKVDMKISGYIQIKTKSGEIYYRAVFPFVFWKVNVGKKETVDENDERAKDYPDYNKFRGEK